MRVARAIVLTEEQRKSLEKQVRTRSLPARLVERCRIIRMAAAGKQDQESEAALGITPLNAQGEALIPCESSGAS